MLVFSVLLFLRQPLSRGLGWLLSIGGETRAPRGASARRRAARVRPRCWRPLAALTAFGLALSNLRQLTSELGRVWLIVGAAWFFFLRAGPLAERLARARPAAASRSGATSGRCCSSSRVLIAAMLVTRDMGPLLIAGYALGRLPRRDGGDVVASAQRPHASAAVRARDRACSRPGSAPSRVALFQARRRRQRDRGAPGEPGRAVRLDQRPARAGVVVPARRAGRRASASAPCRGAATRRPAAAAACRRRSTATTPSPRSSACSARRRPGPPRSAARSGCTG